MHYILVASILLTSFCTPTKKNINVDTIIKVGASQTHLYIPLLKGKRIALVVNQTSTIGKTHLVDSLLSLKVEIKKIFAPEHGFRGDIDAGEQVKNETDVKTGLPLISLYGANKKPKSEQLADIDIVIFDIQDVGARFFTYISTMHYLMEACAENNKTLLILDRPNPHGQYVDGPILQPDQKSFVGMHPIPIIHGLTVGELSRMINGEKWLTNGIQCNTKIISVDLYTHKSFYELPVRPSPNLPNTQAINLYPSLCLFEGIQMSIGKGTKYPFQVIGAPELKNQPFSFVHETIPGMIKNAAFEGKTCFGIDLRTEQTKPEFTLKHVIYFYNAAPDKEKFFMPFFDRLAGSKDLKEQIKTGISEEKIKESWQPDLQKYKAMRKKYLLYPDFE